MDMVLRCAEGGLYRPYWSDEILVEVERNRVERAQRGYLNQGKSADEAVALARDKAAALLADIRRAFPDALVAGTAFEYFKTVVTNHLKDRHVLAAAIAAGARVIVTDNLKDFPNTALAPFHIEAVSSDGFLCDLFDLDADKVLKLTKRRADDLRKPPETFEQMLDSLAKELPEFVAYLRAFHRDRSAGTLPAARALRPPPA